MFHILRSREIPPQHMPASFAAQIFRHGESESNAGLPTVCAATPALTELGRQQAAEIARTLRRAPDLFVLSSYIRTQQTAEPSLRKFPDVPVEIWPVHEFSYLDSARYNGTTSAERAGAVQAYWEKCDPDHLDGTDCESFRQFRERVLNFIERIAVHEGKELAVFSHGHFLRGVFMELEVREEPLTLSAAMQEYARIWRHRPVHNGEQFLLVPRAPGQFAKRYN